VDDIYFPQDTLIIWEFKLSDSALTEKLLIETKNDSFFLYKYNFDPWYGKWFCNFYNGQFKLKENKIHIHANVHNLRKQCVNNDVWRDIEYEFTNWSEQGLTLIKINDTSNCQLEIQEFLIR